MIGTIATKAAALKRVAGTVGGDYAYHALHKRQALQLVDSMLSHSGRQRDAAMFKRCEEYARDVLGSEKYAPWLQAYAVLAGTFKEGWIPDNYYGKVVVPRLQGPYGEISHYKAISSRLFQTDALPDVAYSVNGLLWTASMEPIEPGELKKYLFADNEKIVFKLDAGGQGRSVFVYNSDSFPAGSATPGRTTFGNGVFQSYIVQHPFFDAFDGESVATLRITTVVDDRGNVSCAAGYVRLPRSAETHVKSETAIKVVVNIEDGRLHDTGYLPNWVAVDRHPDSKEVFSGQIVPRFAHAVRTCVELHRKLPLSRAIGWDVVVDEHEEVAVMEWNGTQNDIKFSEAANGPCFADQGWQNLWRSRA